WRPNHPLSKVAERSWALHALAQAYQMTGNPGRAGPLYQRAVSLRQESSFTIDLSSGYRDLAYAQRLVGGLYTSEQAARQAVLLDRQDDNRLLEAISLQVLGLALAARGEAEGSAQALDRSLDLADRTNANRAYNHHAMRALWFGDYQAALQWAEKGQHFSRERKLEAAQILAGRLKGQAALGLGDFPGAERALEQALAEARSVILVEEEIAASIALAELRWHQGKTEPALDLLDELWEPLRHAPYRLFHTDACNLLATILRAQGSNVAAREVALRAYELAWCDGAPYCYHAGLQAARAHLDALEAAYPTLEPFQPAAFPAMPSVDLNPPGPGPQ
ncbi:MAG: tetratricopeptide repeat protein, partial [Anaerolineae bacterium]|nr:tetratricopeptide repeat protein [Anaerolineae bacterium]